MTMNSLRYLVALAMLAVGSTAFAPLVHINRPVRTTHGRSSLAMAKKPTYDRATERWTPGSVEESAENGYDAVGTLLRQGPKAYFQRAGNTDTYDQACLKFMAKDNCSYQMAQGNLDRMAENAQDWTYERMEADRVGRKIDYSKLDQGQVVLTVGWSAVVFLFIGRALYVAITGDSYNF